MSRTHHHASDVDVRLGRKKRLGNRRGMPRRGQLVLKKSAVNRELLDRVLGNFADRSAITMN